MMQLSLNCPAQHAELPQGNMKTRRQRRRGREEGTSPISSSSSGQKKRLLSGEQVRMLELNFRSEQKLERAKKERLATALGLEPQQVAVWFQNRRVKWKSKQLEQEYMNLKKTHQAMLAQKCMLEAEVLKLKKQLSAAQEEMRSKIAGECCNVVGVEDQRSCIPRSSLSMSAADNRFEDIGNNFLHSPDQLYSCHSFNVNGWDEFVSPFYPWPNIIQSDP